MKSIESIIDRAEAMALILSSSQEAEELLRATLEAYSIRLDDADYDDSVVSEMVRSVELIRKANAEEAKGIVLRCIDKARDAFVQPDYSVGDYDDVDHDENGNHRFFEDANYDDRFVEGADYND